MDFLPRFVGQVWRQKTISEALKSKHFAGKKIKPKGKLFIECVNVIPDLRNLREFPPDFIVSIESNIYLCAELSSDFRLRYKPLQRIQWRFYIVSLNLITANHDYQGADIAKRHVRTPSRLRIPMSFSSAANAAVALVRNCFMATSTVSTTWSFLGST